MTKSFYATNETLRTSRSGDVAMDVFVLIGGVTNIPAHELECQLASAGKLIRLVVMDEGDEIATKYAAPDRDTIIDLRRGNWDFFADHKTERGFSGAIEEVAPIDAKRPWIDEGTRIVLAEVLKRVSESPRPSLGLIGDELDRLSPQQVCEIAGLHTDGLNEGGFKGEAYNLTNACRQLVDPYFGLFCDRDRRLPLQSIAAWMSGSPYAILFVNAYGEQRYRETQGNTLIAAVRDHAELAGARINAVAYTDAPSCLRAVA